MLWWTDCSEARQPVWVLHGSTLTRQFMLTRGLRTTWYVESWLPTGALYSWALQQLRRVKEGIPRFMSTTYDNL